MLKTLAPTLALALLTAPIISRPGDAAPTQVRWSPLTEDSVAARQQSEPSARRSGPAGYATEADSTLRHFVVRLSESAESIRGHVDASAAEAASTGSLSFDVTAGPSAFQESPPDGEIHVTVSQESPCGPLGGQVVGCGGHLYREAGGRRTVTAGVVWIAPGLDARGGSVLRDTVLHEFGHALGLGHYDEPYNGEYQVMRSTVGQNVGRYRAGDRSGLVDLAAGCGRVAC